MSTTIMDIDDTIHALLTSFAKELQNHPQNVTDAIEDMKWKLVCAFAASNPTYELATSLGTLDIPLKLAAK